MKSQWVIRVSALAAVIAAGVVFARWEPSDDGRSGFRDNVIVGAERSDIDRARARLRRGLYDEAMAFARAALEREPNQSLALRILAEAYWRRDERGDREKAIVVLRQVDEIETAASSGYAFASDFYRLGLIRKRIGDEESARVAFARSAEMQRAFIDATEEGQRVQSRWYYDLACFEAQAGDREAALDAWERAVEQGYDNLPHAMADADLFTIREDPRFLAAAERIVERVPPPIMREPGP
jgi:tetratricopeptide (TPR) repeat protein